MPLTDPTFVGQVASVTGAVVRVRLRYPYARVGRDDLDPLRDPDADGYVVETKTLHDKENATAKVRMRRIARRRRPPTALDVPSNAKKRADSGTNVPNRPGRGPTKKEPAKPGRRLPRKWKRARRPCAPSETCCNTIAKKTKKNTDAMTTRMRQRRSD